MITFLMDLNVELDGDEIVVTKPKSAFLLAYRKSIEGTLLGSDSQSDAADVSFFGERVPRPSFPSRGEEGARAGVDYVDATRRLARLSLFPLRSRCGGLALTSRLYRLPIVAS